MDLSPLDCPQCEKELVSPLLLPCLHTVCASCSNAQCNMCTNVAGTSKNEPTRDALAEFLLETSHEESEVCANCEEINQPMYFCETCQQPLCHQCKTSTHQAKMFSKHRVLPAEERARVRGCVTCQTHNQPFILYCAAQKSLVCIQCFNETPLENRHHFVPIETGYKSCVEKIEKNAIQLKLFQEEKREELEVRGRILSDSEQHFESAKKDLYQICQQIVDTVLMTRDRLSQRLAEERADAETACRSQMAEIQAILNPIRLCLMASQILCSSAAKLDVLLLSSDLRQRSQQILARSTDKLPASRTAHSLEARTEIAKALEPFLGLSAAWCPISAVREGSKEGTGSTHSYKTRSGSHSLAMPPILPKFQAMIDLSGAFGQLFARVEGPLKEVSSALSVLGQHVQETQRDLTMRRCLIKPDSIQLLTKQCQSVESRLGMHASLLEEIQPEMQQVWQEQLDRVRRQQILFREKADECASLRCTAREVLTAARQLAPFAACIEHMSALIDPRRSHPPDPAPMESICLQISTIEPDSEGRIAAIEKEEQHRKAVQEAKRREEEAGRATVVKGLKPGKAAKRKETSRLMVNTNRERSPGGTDTAVTSPCMRRLSPTVREETLSDTESDCVSTDETFDLWLEETLLNAELALDDQNLVKSSLSLVLGEDPSTIPPPDVSQLAVAVRKTMDIGSSRQSMMQSLHDLFASQKERETSEHAEKNVLASSVKTTQRKRTDSAGTTEAISETESRPTSSVPKKTVRRRRRKSDVETTSTPPESSSTSVAVSPPEVPYVPSAVFALDDSSKLGGFEAKEKVLQSLKEKVRLRAASDLSSE